MSRAAFLLLNVAFGVAVCALVDVFSPSPVERYNVEHGHKYIAKVNGRNFVLEHDPDCLHKTHLNPLVCCPSPVAPDHGIDDFER